MRKRITITNLPVSIKTPGGAVPSEVIGEFSFQLEGEPVDVEMWIERLWMRRAVIRIRKGRITGETLKVEKVSD